MSNHQLSLEIGGRTLSIELNKIARQADGSALLHYGDTVMFVSACSKRGQKEPKPFLPLTVDYRENTYAAGKIPGGFFKREGRPSEREILLSRMIDRPIRSLFPDGYFNETQIVALLLSADLENEPEAMALIGASMALYFSDIPYSAPLGAVKVGYINDEFIINPAKSLLDESPLNMIVVSTEDGIVMIEAGALELSEDKIIAAAAFAHEANQKIIQAQKDLFQQVKIAKREFTPVEIDQDKVSHIEQKVAASLMEAYLSADQNSRREKLTAIQEQLLDDIPEENEDELHETKELLYQAQKNTVRKMILKDKKRADGRAFDDIRPITIETGILPRTHGSAIFTRGETQALATVTLGTSEDKQRIDSLGEETEKRFMLHYNFPPFSVGEVAFLRGPGRREIGHGALAEKSILRSIPDNEGEFPYTIRIVSDILESNGSSSMATVCGGVLALMDAGVPLSMIVAGIAMGLVTDGEQHAVLTDIAGLEDHFGDMDLKIAGSEKGITAIQMDLKVPSIPLSVLQEGLEKAKVARLKVLEEMKKALPEPRAEISQFAPRIINIFVNPTKVGEIIGPSGKIIKKIIAETKTKIDIEEDGKITIASPDMEAVKQAEKMIKDIIAEAEVGKTYMGKVVRIEDYGAFLQILPNCDGLLHVSEISHQRIRNVRDVIKMGQTIKVKVVSIDDNNKIRLSKKALEPGSSNSSDGQKRYNNPPNQQKKGGYSRYNRDKKDRF